MFRRSAWKYFSKLPQCQDSILSAWKYFSKLPQCQDSILSHIMKCNQSDCRVEHKNVSLNKKIVSLHKNTVRHSQIPPCNDVNLKPSNEKSKKTDNGLRFYTKAKPDKRSLMEKRSRAKKIYSKELNLYRMS